MIPQHAWLIPRSCTDLAGRWNEQLSIDQDGEYMCRVVLASTGIKCSPSVFSYYRLHRHRLSTSSSTTARKFNDRILAVDSKAHCLLRIHDSPRARRALGRNYMQIALMAYPKYPSISRVATKRAQEIAGSEYVRTHEFVFPTRLSDRIYRAFGWKVARLIQTAYHTAVSRW